MEANEVVRYNLVAENTVELEEPPISWHVTFKSKDSRSLRYEICALIVSIIHRT